MKHLTILFLLPLYLIFTGCIKIPHEEIQITLSVSESSLNFASSSESKTLSINSNDRWTVGNDASSWLTVSSSSGTNNGMITVTATANTITASRTATITVNSSVQGVSSQTISVTQMGVAPVLTVSETSLEFLASGEQKTFTVASNISWTVSSSAATWLTVSPESGSNNGMVTVTASSNSSSSQRTATITVSGGGIVRTNSVMQAGTVFTEPEMIFVQGGTFTMGCTSEQGEVCWDHEKPAHQVTLSDFYIGKYEVTQEQWRAVMGNNPSHFTGDEHLPVENVLFNEVQEFITILNSLTGKKYRLPTEAEWEYAARGGRNSLGFMYSGSNTVGNVAWYSGNSNEKTHPVGTKTPNELGIYDMSGNVMEW